MKPEAAGPADPLRLERLVADLTLLVDGAVRGLPASVQRLRRALGMALRRPGADRRSLDVRLTQRGEELATVLDGARVGAMTHLLAGLSPPCCMRCSHRP